MPPGHCSYVENCGFCGETTVQIYLNGKQVFMFMWRNIGALFPTVLVLTILILYLVGKRCPLSCDVISIALQGG